MSCLARGCLSSSPLHSDRLCFEKLFSHFPLSFLCFIVSFHPLFSSFYVSRCLCPFVFSLLCFDFLVSAIRSLFLSICFSRFEAQQLLPSLPLLFLYLFSISFLRRHFSFFPSFVLNLKKKKLRHNFFLFFFLPFFFFHFSVTVLFRFPHFVVWDFPFLRHDFFFSLCLQEFHRFSCLYLLVSLSVHNTVFFF